MIRHEAHSNRCYSAYQLYVSWPMLGIAVSKRWLNSHRDPYNNRNPNKGTCINNESTETSTCSFRMSWSLLYCVCLRRSGPKRPHKHADPTSWFRKGRWAGFQRPPSVGALMYNRQMSQMTLRGWVAQDLLMRTRMDQAALEALRPCMIVAGGVCRVLQTSV